MKISTDTPSVGFSTHAQGASPTGAPSASFASALSTAMDAAVPAAGPDFTRMTRQGMLDWVNGQIRSGQLSLDDSTALMGMTIKISATTGQPVPMATDSTRIDFVDKARQGIAGALANNDPDLAGRLRQALAIMQGARD